MDLGLIIQLVSGAVGGNIAGSLMKKYSLGPVLNSIIGILGGGIGGQVMGTLGLGAAGGMDLATILTQVAGGGVGGGVLLAFISLLRSAMAKS